MENGLGEPVDNATRSPTKKSDKAESGDRHKRSLSGSLLSKLSFLRTSAEPTPPAQVDNPADNGTMTAAHGDGDEKYSRGSAMAAVVRQTKTRRRRGSLRKTAILGTGKLKERRNSIIEPPWRATGQEEYAPGISTTNGGQPTQSSDSDQSPISNSPEKNGNWPAPQEINPRLPLNLDTRLAVNKASGSHVADSSSPPHIISPTANSYTSTTDDDDGLTFSHRPTIHPQPYFPLHQPSIPSSTTSLQRRRSNKSTVQRTSPLSLPASSANLLVEEEEWDYAETEWWGWIVLLVTWIVFVVGMGSCFGVWSWAWDVGETPYAPPELEDDPTLPITGYYPALMILTGIMAWVWVIVAWVGMKYFRHAKMMGDE